MGATAQVGKDCQGSAVGVVCLGQSELREDVSDVLALDKAQIGNPVPYIPPTGAAAVIGSVAILATATIMASLHAMPERRG